MKSLIDIGFQEIGSWSLQPGGLHLSLESMADAMPALYAFVASGEVKYVGKTKRHLKQRLYGYLKPGKSQRTNIRVPPMPTSPGHRAGTGAC